MISSYFFFLFVYFFSESMDDIKVDWTTANVGHAIVTQMDTFGSPRHSRMKEHVPSPSAVFSVYFAPAT
jgi:hypothetical protein